MAKVLPWSLSNAPLLMKCCAGPGRRTFCSAAVNFLFPRSCPPSIFYINIPHVNVSSPCRSSCADIGLSANLWQSLDSFTAGDPCGGEKSPPISPLFGVWMWSRVHFHLINWPFLLTRNLCSNNLLEIDAEHRKWDIHQGARVPPAAPRLIWKYFRLHRPCCLRSQDYIYPRSIACLTGAHGGLW